MSATVTSRSNPLRLHEPGNGIPQKRRAARSRGSNRRLKIAVFGPVWFPVPPHAYGGTERIVSLLTEGLVEAGHDVTLFASGDSKTAAKLVSSFPLAPSQQQGETVPELANALFCYERANEFDIVSDHSGALGAALSGLVRTPVVHTTHGTLEGELGHPYEQIASLNSRLGLISLSHNQREPRPNLPWVGNCPNAIDLSAHPPGRHEGNYLAFLGRMCAEKGAHRAIEVAKALDMPLKIAAKMHTTQEVAYFETFIRPQLGPDIEYVGELGGPERLQLLQDARVTLFPIDWREPFGLVMIESMACGTPVIATRRGAVPEVIEHGRGGIIVDDTQEMIRAVALAEQLDPRECRRSVEERFTPHTMVDAYLEVFERVIHDPGAGLPTGRPGNPTAQARHGIDTPT